MNVVELENYHCPRWNELPEFPLYMDQVVMIISKPLALFDDNDDASITPAMINNYVKLKLIDPPIKKKYSKEQISRLIVFALLKKSFSMQETSKLIDVMVNAYGSEKAYDLFCDELESYLHIFFGEDRRSLSSLPHKEDKIDQLMQVALITLLSKVEAQNQLATFDL